MTSTNPHVRTPSIAVIVPNWNDARFLPRCISSILDQEVPPDELILVDDQSTDDSVAVMRSLIASRSGVQLIENMVNLGVYGAVDEGLKRSRSEYVLFLSSNDFVLPGIFARAKTCLTKCPGVGLWSAMGWLVDEEDRLIALHSSPAIARGDACFTPEQCLQLAWRFGNWFTGTTLIYHRDTLDAAGRFDPANKGLADLITALIVASRRGAAYSPIPLAAVRIHRGSHISSTLGDTAVIDSILDRLREHGPNLAPHLLTSAFLDRTALRFHYMAVYTSRGAAICGVAEKCTGWSRRALVWIDRIVPPRFWRFRVRLASLVLCPFDFVHMFWNRVVVRTIMQVRYRQSAIESASARRSL